MTPPELAQFQNENKKGNENEFSLVSSSPHPFIPFLIPYATHANAVLLTVEAAAYIGIVVEQKAEPSDVRIVLCTTPPATEAAKGDVRTKVEAVTAREACESAFVRGLLVG